MGVRGYPRGLEGQWVVGGSMQGHGHWQYVKDGCSSRRSAIAGGGCSRKGCEGCKNACERHLMRRGRLFGQEQSGELLDQR